MRYGRLIEGRLVRRYKRFLADVALGGDPAAVVTVHCANPGAMTTCMADGARVWLSDSDDPRRKLRYTWELCEVGGALVAVHTGRANAVVAEALAAGAIAELAGWPEVRREVRYGERSRVDFLLERPGPRGDVARLYLEVKTVTLDRGAGLVAFPDAVSTRGARHLDELAAMVAAGHRAALLFVVARQGALRVAPADDVDPAYGVALRRAAAAGVELLAYRCDVGTDALTLAERLPIDLSASAIGYASATWPSARSRRSGTRSSGSAPVR